MWRVLLLAVVGSVACRAPSTTHVGAGAHAIVAPNDNRTPAGTLRDGVLTVELDAIRAGWRPDEDVDSVVTVYVFAERGKPPQVPGPLIRVPEGTEVRVSVRNLVPDSSIRLLGLSGARGPADTVVVAPGETRMLSFRADAPGTFLYRGLTKPITGRPVLRRDETLAGALVVDPRGVRPDPTERIFVINLVDIYPDSTAGVHDEAWEIAVNGLSWPHTERLRHTVGDTVRWRWVNATDRIHPMHLHGFHFRVLSKGSLGADTVYARETARLAVTEFMPARSTFTMEWVPARAGNWLMHCHMLGHILPFPMRADTVRAHDMHAPERHVEQAMAGLVMAVEVTGEWRSDPARARGGVHHRLLVQEHRPGARSPVRRSYILQRDAEPRADSVEIPGTPLVVKRGRTASVTIVNRLSEPTSVHWHGMELESVFDGVPGFSGVGRSRSPLIARGDSFTVSFTPPRAGTYMYHTHMDEEDQLEAGLYAPLLVLEPDESYDASTDHILMLGFGHDSAGNRTFAVNGRAEPRPITVRAGIPHRLRLLNLLANNPTRVALRDGDQTLLWRAISKDGAALPEALRVARPAVLAPIGVGETYDAEWTPVAGQNPGMTFVVFEGGAPVRTLRLPFIVR